MSLRYQYVSMDRIFTKLGRDIGNDIPETDVIEWTGEALGFIGAVKNREEAVSFIEVINHQCDLPLGIHAIIQIARNNNWSRTDSCSPKAIVEELVVEEVISGVPVAIDAQGMPLNAYDVAYYRPFFDLRLEVNGWSNSAVYRRQFTPVRLATNTLFNSLVCRYKDSSLNIGTGKDEYKIVLGKYARFSFSSGQVAIAHLRQVRDPETGYPMIPDNESYTTAIVEYINMKRQWRNANLGREGALGLYDRAVTNWHWYCKQAGNVDKMPYGIDEHQNLLDQRSYLIPQQNRYYGFFGNLNAPNNTIYGGRNPIRITNRGVGASEDLTINNTTVVNNDYDTGELSDDQW